MEIIVSVNGVPVKWATTNEGDTSNNSLVAC